MLIKNNNNNNNNNNSNSNSNNNSNLKLQSGFTLIELMIVIVIIGLLTSIALPAYENYINRAKITEGFQLASEPQAYLTEWINLHGNLEENPFTPGSENNPDNPDNPDSPYSPENLHGKYVQKISVSQDGIISVLFNKQAGAIANKGFILKPLLSSDKSRIFEWRCSPINQEDAELINPLLPSSCKN